MILFLDQLVDTHSLPMLKGPAWGMAGVVLHACHHSQTSHLLTTPYHNLLDEGIDGNKQTVHILENGIVLTLEDKTAILARLQEPHKPWKGKQSWEVAPAAWNFKACHPDTFLHNAQKLLNTDAAFTGTGNFLYPDNLWPTWDSMITFQPTIASDMRTLACATALYLTGKEPDPFSITAAAAFETTPKLLSYHPDPKIKDAIDIVLNDTYPTKYRYSQDARRYTQFGKRKIKTHASQITGQNLLSWLSAHEKLTLFGKIESLLHAHRFAA